MSKTYIFEAIEVEQLGLKVRMKETSQFKMPDKFKKALDDNSDLKPAIKALTPGRQRGYLLYFSQAKQSKIKYREFKNQSQMTLKNKN